MAPRKPAKKAIAKRAIAKKPVARKTVKRKAVANLHYVTCRFCFESSWLASERVDAFTLIGLTGL